MPRDTKLSGSQPKTFTILLVEDDAGDVDMFLRTVEHELPRHEDEQVDVVINATAEGALERLRQQPINLIIADVRLPGMSGIDLLRSFTNPSFRVVFVTAFDAYALEAFRLSAIDYLLKPLDGDDIVRVIQKIKKDIDKKQIK